MPIRFFYFYPVLQMSFLVFISHSSKNKSIADAICSRLENHGVRCWIAPRDVNPGADYSNQIADALERSKVMILVFSSDANHSRHVKSEIDRAFNLEQTIIPFRVEDVEPDKGLSYYLGRTHWLDAMTPPLGKHIDRLVGIVQQLACATPPPPPEMPSSMPAIPPLAPGKKSSAAKAMIVGAGIAIVGVAGLALNYWFFPPNSAPIVNQTPDAGQNATPESVAVTKPDVPSLEPVSADREGPVAVGTPAAISEMPPVVPATSPAASATPTKAESPAPPEARQAPPNALAAAAEAYNARTQKVSVKTRAEMKRELAGIAANPDQFIGKEVEVTCYALIDNIQGRLQGTLTADPMWVGAIVMADFSNLPAAKRELAVSADGQVITIKGRMRRGSMGPTIMVSSVQLAAAEPSKAY